MRLGSRLAAALAVALAALALLRAARRRGPAGRPPGCDEAQSPGLNGSGALLADELFARLCAAAPLPGARGGCFEVDGSVLCLPTFLVVGFTKAGTTAFFRYLAQHPLVSVSTVKEPGYLGAEAEAADRAAVAAARAARAAARAARGAPAAADDRASSPARRPAKSLRWYAELFGACARCERGEATPSYAWRDSSPSAAAHARLLLGAVSLVMLVREPLGRAASHYAYFRQKRYASSANLSAALGAALDELQLCAAQLGGWRHACAYRDGRRAAEASAAAAEARRPRLWRHRRSDRAFELLQAGLYTEHMATWRAQLPRGSRLLVLSSAALWAEPAAVLGRFERFAGLPPAAYALSAARALPRRDGRGPPSAAAAGGEPPRIEPALRLQLERFLAPFNRELAAQTGIVFSETPAVASGVT